MKYFILFLLCTSPIMGEGIHKDIVDISKKIEKRKGYCSPLDKMMKKCESKNGETDKEILNSGHKKMKEISKKIQKREGYCSPLDKLRKKCKNSIKEKK